MELNRLCKATPELEDKAAELRKERVVAKANGKRVMRPEIINTSHFVKKKETDAMNLKRELPFIPIKEWCKSHGCKAKDVDSQVAFAKSKGMKPINVRGQWGIVKKGKGGMVLELTSGISLTKETEDQFESKGAQKESFNQEADKVGLNEDVHAGASHPSG